MSKLTEEAAAFIMATKKAAAKPNYLQVAEKVLGRELEDYETIIFIDGNQQNSEASNLLVGFKAGVPYSYLTCRNCGARVISQTGPAASQDSPAC